MIEDRGATIEDRGAVAFLSTTAFHIQLARFFYTSTVRAGAAHTVYF